MKLRVNAIYWCLSRKIPNVKSDENGSIAVTGVADRPGAMADTVAGRLG